MCPQDPAAVPNAESKLASTIPHESHGVRGQAGTIATTTDPNS